MPMKKTAVLFLLFLPVFVHAQTNAQDTLTREEEAAVAAILAKNQPVQEVKAPANAPEEKIVLPEQTKKEALGNAATPQTQNTPNEPEEETDEPQTSGGKCLTVAFIDIDEAFNEHPRTIAVKEQIHLKIQAKETEVQNAKELIAVLERENMLLAAQLRELKPFYTRIVVEPQPLLPKIEEPADTLVLNNLLNRLTFAGAEILSTSPLNTPAQLDDLKDRIAANKKVIAEREFFIDNYRYTTREEILNLEKKEVNEILQDIYTQIKSFAKKRNIGAIVRKDELLYGQAPVNVTKDFINQLKKSKKYRKRGK